MNDAETIESTAKHWVACGGDVIGFEYCYHSVLLAIREELERLHPDTT